VRRRARWRLGLAVVLTGLAVGAVALAAAFPALLRIPRREPARAPATLPLAAFSHPAHRSWGCYACHPSVFPQAPLAFTHAEMRQGRFCGACHDGANAFAMKDAACERCHAPR